MQHAVKLCLPQRAEVTMSLRQKLRNPGLLHPLTVPLVLLALTLAMFGSVLFSGAAVVLSHRGDDLYSQFVYWRSFGFGQLKQGHLALWNPHVFSGTPFFSTFEPALLYPINWVHLVLPLAKALNTEIVLH